MRTCDEVPTRKPRKVSGLLIKMSSAYVPGQIMMVEPAGTFSIASPMVE
jgi:hypothetical protein